ncbi:hypothetical protein GFK26_15085 [Variovorax paradoxus]|uniref:Uncharacterized protein n=1 Tax=Variovorax paradoxus TaxID=34073 RepID=A0A5Q0M377_VARPD|nr:hypothetical protein GFK26_15085 [Variovorax paradoxus]
MLRCIEHAVEKPLRAADAHLDELTHGGAAALNADAGHGADVALSGAWPLLGAAILASMKKAAQRVSARRASNQ